MHPAGDGGDDELFGVREVWPPGTIIKGDYAIERKLGGGGFGTVYLAKHRFMGSTHVIKRLHDQYAADKNYVLKFFNEGRAVRRLKGCPYIVEVEHMTRSEDGHLILVMEYVSGGDLAGLMKSRTVGVAEAMEFGRHIALGLEAAHKEGLIHRDIKPENVMMGRDYSGNSVLKIIDFGIAADHGNANHQTSVMHAGLIGYAAPEQWMLAGKDLDGRTDLYALGATLYRLLTGQMPFQDVDSIGSWIDRVRMGPPPPHQWDPQPPPIPRNRNYQFPPRNDRKITASAGASRTSTPLKPSTYSSTPAAATPKTPPPRAPRTSQTPVPTPPGSRPSALHRSIKSTQFSATSCTGLLLDPLNATLTTPKTRVNPEREGEPGGLRG